MEKVNRLSINDIIAKNARVLSLARTIAIGEPDNQRLDSMEMFENLVFTQAKNLGVDGISLLRKIHAEADRIDLEREKPFDPEN